MESGVSENDLLHFRTYKTKHDSFVLPGRGRGRVLRLIRRRRKRNGAWEGGDEEDREQGEPAGDLLQAPQGAAEESRGARRALRRGRRRHRLLRTRQAVRLLLAGQVWVTKFLWTFL